MTIEEADKYKYLETMQNYSPYFTIIPDTLARATDRGFGSLMNGINHHKDVGFKTYTTLYNISRTPILDHDSAICGTHNFQISDRMQIRASHLYIAIGKYSPIADIVGGPAWYSCSVGHRYCLHLQICLHQVISHIKISRPINPEKLSSQEDWSHSTAKPSVCTSAGASPQLHSRNHTSHPLPNRPVKVNTSFIDRTCFVSVTGQTTSLNSSDSWKLHLSILR